MKNSTATPLTREQILEWCGKTIWEKFARISDPAYADRRWARMQPIAKQAFIDEAEACIRAYEALKGGFDD